MIWAMLWAWPPFTGTDVVSLRYTTEQVNTAAAKLNHDPRMPKWAAAALGFCMLPIPGPFDNIAAIIIAVILLIWPRTRHALLDAWPAPRKEHHVHA